jgi:hypothetical protein
MLNKKVLIMIALAALLQPAPSKTARGNVFDIYKPQWANALKQADQAIADGDNDDLRDAVNSGKEAFNKLSLLLSDKLARQYGITNSWVRDARATLTNLENQIGKLKAPIRKDVVDRITRFLELVKAINESDLPSENQLVELDRAAKALAGNYTAAEAREATHAEMDRALLLSIEENDTKQIVVDARKKMGAKKAADAKKKQDDDKAKADADAETLADFFADTRRLVINVQEASKKLDAKNIKGVKEQALAAAQALNVLDQAFKKASAGVLKAVLVNDSDIATLRNQLEAARKIINAWKPALPPLPARPAHPFDFNEKKKALAPQFDNLNALIYAKNASEARKLYDSLMKSYDQLAAERKKDVKAADDAGVNETLLTDFSNVLSLAEKDVTRLELDVAAAPEPSAAAAGAAAPAAPAGSRGTNQRKRERKKRKATAAAAAAAADDGADAGGAAAAPAADDDKDAKGKAAMPSPEEIAKAQAATNLKKPTSVASSIAGALKLPDTDERKLTRLKRYLADFKLSVDTLIAAGDPLASGATKLLTEAQAAINSLNK